MHRSTIEGQGLYKDKYMGKISLTKQNNCVVHTVINLLLLSNYSNT